MANEHDTNEAAGQTSEGATFDPDSLRQKYRDERDKRLRHDGNEQYVEVKEEFAHFLDDPYAEPGFEREALFDEVEVLVIGGGFGGLLAGARDCVKPESKISESSTRHPTSAEPGTGIVTQESPVT